MYRLLCTSVSKNVASAGWKVTLGDHIRPVSFRSGEDSYITAISIYRYLYKINVIDNNDDELEPVTLNQ